MSARSATIGGGGLLALAEAWPSADEVARVLTLRAGHNSAIVVLAAALLGLAAGVVGALSMLRRRSMMSDAIAHCTLPGIAIAFIVATGLGAAGRSLPVLLFGAAVSAVLGVLVVQFLVRRTRLHEDAAIAAVLSVFFGLGVVLLSVIQRMASGTQGGISHFIYGQTAAMQVRDAELMGGLALASTLVAVALLKEFRVVCFDERYAASIGLRVTTLDLVMMTLVVAVTVVGLQAVGLILVVAMLIIPAAAARLWTERFGRVVVLAGALGAVSGYAGASASALLPRLPAGAVIVLASAGIFGVSLLVSPRRGILATAVRRAALRVAIMRDHALRAMWELLETDGESVAISDLAAARRWPRWKAALAARWMVARGLAVRGRTGDAGARAGVSLTPAGRLAARDVVLRHRAFERFLVDEVRLDPTHVDASADLVEHAIDPAMLAELARTRAEDAGTPRSVHPIERPRR